MTEEVQIVKVSKPMSLELWSLLTYIKGRKKGMIAIIATGLMMIMQDSELAALLGGLVFEGIFSIVEFYLKKVEVTE